MAGGAVAGRRDAGRGKPGSTIRLLTTVALAQALVAGIAIGGARADDEPTSDAPPVLEALERAFSDAAAKVADAVVGIEVDLPTSRRPGRRVPEMLRRPDTPASGVIVDSSGLVLTSAGLVDGATAVRVILRGGGVFAADVVATDQKLELALLQAHDTPADLPAVRFGDTAPPAPGSWLIVVGFGPEKAPTINTGVVSAIGRFDAHMLQTDAALSHTNRGGVAIDLDGNPVGVAVYPSDRAGVNSGVGFIAAARHIAAHLPKLRTGESVTQPKRGFLGIRLGNEQLEPAGVAIAEVLDGHAAEAAGLQNGDVVRRIGDRPITDGRSLSRAIRQHPPGSRVPFVVLRDGKELQYVIELGERPERE